MARSSSRERLCLDESGNGGVGDTNERDDHRRKKRAVGVPAIVEMNRAPARISMFPLCTPIQSSSKRDKGKESVSPGDTQKPDSIELMPQLHRQQGGNESEEPEEDPDKMVIRKEVRYSVQYEYDEERRGQGMSKSSTDAMAYV